MTKRPGTSLRIRMADFKEERLCLEVREMIYGALLNQIGRQTTAEAFQSVASLRCVERATHRVVHASYLMPLLEAMYHRKATIRGLSIRAANSVLDLVPFMGRSPDSAWSLFSLLTYYQERSHLPLEAYSSDADYFNEQDVVGKHFYCASDEKVMPLQSMDSLVMVEGLAATKSALRLQMDRYIETFSDEDERARLRQLLKKASYLAGRGFFLSELVALHATGTQSCSDETLARRQAFPLAFTSLPAVEHPENVKLLNVAFRVTAKENSAPDYRFFLTSGHAEVRQIKRSMFRLFTSAEVTETTLYLRLAHKAHRLRQASAEMDYRKNQLLKNHIVYIIVLS